MGGILITRAKVIQKIRWAVDLIASYVILVSLHAPLGVEV